MEKGLTQCSAQAYTLCNAYGEKMNLDEARFTIGQVCKVTGVEANTLRSWFQRGHLRLIKGKDRVAKGEGLPRLFSARSVLGIAVMGAATSFKMRPEKAAEVGYDFAVFGTEGRDPGELFNDGFTALTIFQGGLFEFKNVHIGPKPPATNIVELLIPEGHNRTDAVTIIILNFIVDRVLKALMEMGEPTA